MTLMNCRPRCGACCIAPSISSAIPGMPGGKPAGVRCVQLDDAMRCRIFGDPARPAVCGGLQPAPEMCGDDRGQALRWLGVLDAATRPEFVMEDVAAR
jgi:Fe-S-cluster containining protein